MPRQARIVIPGAAHHITQRGVRCQQVFFNDADRNFYLKCMLDYCVKLEIQVLAYCLMTNHVHHILVPPDKNSLAGLFKPLHIRFSYYINKRYHWSGHLWQQRFYSSPLEDDYLLVAIRYVERNPVKANMVLHASDYQWCSAPARCGLRGDPLLSQDPIWQSRLANIDDWETWLGKEEDPKKIKLLRDSTARDLPTGSSDFLRSIQANFNRQLSLRSKGRPSKKMLVKEACI